MIATTLFAEPMCLFLAHPKNCVSRHLILNCLQLLLARSTICRLLHQSDCKNLPSCSISLRLQFSFLGAKCQRRRCFWLAMIHRAYFLWLVMHLYNCYSVPDQKMALRHTVHAKLHWIKKRKAVWRNLTPHQV